MTALDHRATSWPPTTLLGRLPNRSRRNLLTMGTMRRFSAHDPLLKQGDRNAHSLLLLTGAVKVSSLDESGHEAMLGIRVAGDLVGEMATLAEVRRTATVRACADVTARQLNRAELTSFLHEHPDAAVEVSIMLIERLRRADQRLIDFGACAAPARVGRTLLELAYGHGEQEAMGWSLGVPLTKAELASLAGVKLPTLEKVLSELRRLRIIVRRNREILIADLGRLREYSQLSPENP